MSLVVCKCGCGQKIESSFSYRVPLNGITFKFINEQHYRKWIEQSKKKREERLKLTDEQNSEFDLIYNEIITIFGNDLYARDFVKKELESWKAIATADQILSYLKDNRAALSKSVRGKSFSSIYGSIKYIGAIIQNNVVAYKREKINESGLNMQQATEKEGGGIGRGKKRISLAELEDDV